MPGTGVYFVNSASRALCAAALMASGVPKSGSPAPKSITSTPERRSLSTVAPTAIVADVAIREVRSANRAIDSPKCGLNVVQAFRPARYGGPEGPHDLLLRTNGLLLPQACFHQFRHQSVHPTAQREHFLDQPRAD